MDITHGYGVVLIDYKSINRTIKYIMDLISCVDILPRYIVVIDNDTSGEAYHSFVEEFCMNECPLQIDGRELYIQFNAIYEGTFNNVKLIFVKSNDNLGYARANNLGINILSNLH